MAEAGAVPLAIAGSQGCWFVVQKLRQRRPKYRLQKWEDRVNEAMAVVKKERSGVNPNDMKTLLTHYSMYYFFSFL